MIRVAAFTSGRDDPSTRFRLRQFFEPLRGMGIEAAEFRPWVNKYARAPWQLTGLGLVSRAVAVHSARNYDIAWLNREYFTGHATLERFAAKRRLFDVDDGIWLPSRNDFARDIARHCQGVLAGNECIAQHFRGSTPQVWVVPTVVDTCRFVPGPPTSDESFFIGWSGTHWNLPYLHGIEVPLRRFLEDHRNATLLIVCNRRPKLDTIPANRMKFLKWTAQTEVEVLQKMDVGIMPLPDDAWTRAKCALKMLCYMAVELPVVVSPVGVAKDILARGPLGIAATSADDWYDALEALYRDREKRASLGQCGRLVVRQHYSVDKVATLLYKIFSEVVSEPA